MATARVADEVVATADDASVTADPLTKRSRRADDEVVAAG